MDLASLIAELERLWITTQNELVGLVQPWRLHQIAILLVGFLIALFAD